MRAISSMLFLTAAIAALTLQTGPALADRIDGNWCFTDGRHMSIEGPSIITPGGTRMQGRYNRHGFEYTVPAGEADAGADVAMVQFDEYTVQVVTTPTGGAAARSETWKRCDLTT